MSVKCTDTEDLLAKMNAAWEREAATLTALDGMPDLYVGLIRAAFNRGYLARYEEEIQRA